MNLEKLRYDLAMQLASTTFLVSKLHGHKPDDNYMELFEIFAANYEQYQKIPDSDFLALLKPD